MTRPQSISRGIASNWAGLAVTIIIAFFLSPYLVNKLGSVYYGIWALTLQFTGYLHLFDFGVRDSVVRYTSKYAARGQRERLNAILSTAMLLYAPIALLCTLLTAAAVALAPGPFEIAPGDVDDMRWAVFFSGLTIAQTFVFNVFGGIIYGLRRYDVQNGMAIGFAILRAFLIVVFLSRGYGLIAVAAIQFGVALANGLLGMVVGFGLLRGRGVPFSLTLPSRRRLIPLAQRIFGYGAYSLIHSIGQKIVFGSDAIVAGVMLSVAAVTHYSIAGSLVQYFRTLVLSASRVFVPASSELHARGQLEALSRLLLTGAKLTALIALPIGTVCVVLGRDFIGLWMGPAFMEDAGDVLFVLAIAQIFSAPHNVITSVLYGISRHRQIAWLRLAEACANLVLSVALAKPFGLVGIALGTAIPHVFMATWLMPRIAAAAVRFRMRDYLFHAYARPSAAVVPFAAAALAVRHYVALENLLEFFAAVGLLLVLYAPCVYFLALTDAERALVLRKVGLRPALARR